MVISGSGGTNGFFQNSIGADALRFAFIQGIKGSYEQYHRQVRKAGIFFYVFADLIPVSHGHEDIGEHQVRRKVGQFPDGGLTVVYGHHFHAKFSQGQGHGFLDVTIVVGYQDLCHLPASRNAMDTEVLDHAGTQQTLIHS